MELYDVMRTTAAVREFTDDPLPDEVLHAILENARFAPSGGNRQGAQLVVVRDPATRERLVEATVPVARRYHAQRAAGDKPAARHPLNAWMARHGDTALLSELAFLAVFTFAAIGTDDFWQCRAARERRNRSPDRSAAATENDPFRALVEEDRRSRRSGLRPTEPGG